LFRRETILNFEEKRKNILKQKKNMGSVLSHDTVADFSVGNVCSVLIEATRFAQVKLYNFSQNLFKYVNVEWFSLKIIPGKALKV
jgi:hypothetical protein